jgi:DICT domain-containing protein/signal transduction histidine kinase
MMTKNSLLADLLQSFPELKIQVYFKSSLTALSHAMEDQVLADANAQSLVIASFQQARFYRQEAHRYRSIAQHTDQVYILSAPETEFSNSSEYYETIAFDPKDPLASEWHLVVIGKNYSYCLICQERETTPEVAEELDATRSFEGIWTFDRTISCQAAALLLDRILIYRPELATKIASAKVNHLPCCNPQAQQLMPSPATLNPDPFVQRLVTYLQAGQYKLTKAYRSIAAQEQKERLLNFITTAIRRSLNPEEILEVAVQELGRALESCRCLIYQCRSSDRRVVINHEFLQNPQNPKVLSLKGLSLNLTEYAPWQKAGLEPLLIPEVTEPIPGWFPEIPPPNSCLLVPVLYQSQLLGMIELHHYGAESYQWQEDEISLVQAISTQIGIGLIQADAYSNLEDLNQQLAALDRTRSNLVAITGHELRTPLSTIQVCLESLAAEPDMPPEMRQIMLKTALTDSERMRKLVQDFLTLSRLESGRVEWHPEPLSIQECVDLALSSLRSNERQEQPKIITQLPENLPPVQADGEWLVEVLTKLLDNACKFTSPQGQISVQTEFNGGIMLEVTVADTGRGIERNQLETVFDRFYQEEGALRRTTGGTGLGLAICRQIVTGWGGEIWADSAGKDQGSSFHFTIPIFTQ